MSEWSKETEERLRGQHKKARHAEYCWKCDVPWPCPTIAALDETKRLEAERDDVMRSYQEVGAQLGEERERADRLEAERDELQADALRSSPPYYRHWEQAEQRCKTLEAALVAQPAPTHYCNKCGRCYAGEAEHEGCNYLAAKLVDPVPQVPDGSICTACEHSVSDHNLQRMTGLPPGLCRKCAIVGDVCGGGVFRGPDQQPALEQGARDDEA